MSGAILKGIAIISRNNFLKSSIELSLPVWFSCRLLSQTNVNFGRRSRDPYDRRWGIHPKDVSKKGGTSEMAKEMGKRPEMPRPMGYFDRKGILHPCQEMIPEFIVPDLKDFNLKPYVSYRVSDVKQSALTAQDLFNATYAKEIVDDFKAGKLKASDIDTRIDKLKLKKFN